MDSYILAQGLLYFCICITGLTVSITVGVNQNRFDGSCILYATFTKYERGFLMIRSATSNCTYPTYFSVIGLVIYGLAMGIYYMYCFFMSFRDPGKGSQMWVKPFLIMNTVVAIFTLVSACIVSVGYAEFCSGYVEINGGGVECSSGENTIWHYPLTGEKFNPGNYVSFMKSAQAAAWLSFLFLVAQITLGVLSLFRNRHKRSSAAAKKATQTANAEPPLDKF